MDDIQRERHEEQRRKDLAVSVTTLVVSLVWGTCALVLRLTHLDMTETRLFLSFWWWWLLMAPAYFVLLRAVKAVLRRR